MNNEILQKFETGEIIDLKGKTIMPGMIDVHVHLTLDGEASYLHTLIIEYSKLSILKVSIVLKMLLMQVLLRFGV